MSIALLALAVPSTAQTPYWQCATFARTFSGLQIWGDAHTWWDKAAAHYQRGERPRVGAVMAFVPSGRMRLGHVATVTQVLGSRDILVTHANWSPIDGSRGKIERNVAVRDVSEYGDWSRVRVWFDPIADLGTTAWPIHGFIYPTRVPGPFDAPPLQVARASPAPRLQYARLDTLGIDAAVPRRSLLGDDVMRLARAEARGRPTALR